jgi:lipopolysaccharide/colanic/teichoic acid biosynthesis glycosyltransferase
MGQMTQIVRSAVSRFRSASVCNRTPIGGKRVFDLALCALLAVPAVTIAAVLCIVLLATQGRPVLHGSPRATVDLTRFTLWKFRTLRPSPTADGVSGGHLKDRITPAGAILRRTRLDEIPQLWNILLGQMSFVGPRPPLHAEALAHPHHYRPVLTRPPGLTGLATLALHRFESSLMATATEPDAAGVLYAARCRAAKLAAERLYRRKECILLDLAIIGCTIADRMGMQTFSRLNSRLLRRVSKQG